MILPDIESSQLQDEARKRKERLEQWKNKKILKRKKNDDSDGEEKKDDEEDNEPMEFPKPIFRNYKPISKDLNAILLPKPKLIDIKPMIEDVGSGETNGPPPIDDVDLTTLAPRKPDWDLKRDVEKKLKRLEKRTTRAIAELTRQRLLIEQKGSHGAVDFAEIISTTSRINQHQEDDDD
ncbi:unnamed protein product [Didymodactylos carnosus]|uniref:Coiled-coil domain-containing protein 12 n=1 Tax=Didymodactylos carnosus TaxID=1234261 RepID=A0A813UPY3_9BILA|nr:unnamed protein product [Didymodactylos carnosus]CAF0832989.1 unnamed protein product [Didymodactylos carnosus]CAF3593440.1 unnamed protein product [Didymodactylos carnosus]CAF3620063.1 unnamed protein product [Didymodactylos carnosus]